MGLNARVYVHRNKLPIDLDLSQARVDQETGEVFFDQPSAATRKLSLVALDKRLGNTSLIRSLAEQVGEVLGATSDSVLIARVLYSGSHSGDMIGQRDLGALRKEITSVWRLTEGRRSSELTKFLDDLQELARTAEEQCNPIVFV